MAEHECKDFKWESHGLWIECSKCRVVMVDSEVEERVNATERLSAEYVRALIGELEARGYDNLVALTAYADAREEK